MRVSVLTNSISRIAGGISESVKNFSQEISALHTDNRVCVHAMFDRYSEEDRRSWMPIEPNLHAIKGPASFGYAPQLSSSVKRSNPDIIHQHGLWMFPSVVASKYAIQGTKTIVSPHGMLDNWAINNSKYKKMMAYFLFEKKTLQIRCAYMPFVNKSIDP